MSRIVPIQSDINANSAFFAPAGGAGGGGATVSSLTFTTDGDIYFTNSLNLIEKNFANPSSFTFATLQDSAITGIPTNLLTMVSPINEQQVTHYTADGNMGLRTYDTGGSGGTIPYNIDCSVLNTPSVNTNTATISSLTVSSINGQTPGGGGAANIRAGVQLMPIVGGVASQVVTLSSPLPNVALVSLTYNAASARTTIPYVSSPTTSSFTIVADGSSVLTWIATVAQ